MTTIDEALVQMGLDGGWGERCVARIQADGPKILQWPTPAKWFSYVGDVTNLYTTVARYRPGSIQGHTGRTAENCIAVDALIFDADLKDYATWSLQELHENLTHDELDTYITGLRTDVEEVFARCGVPIGQIINTGYGIAIYVWIDEADKHRVEEIDALQKTLVARINEEYGKTAANTRLLDRAVNDPRTRLTRVVGSINGKGHLPREVRCLMRKDVAIRLDDFSFAPPTVRPAAPLPDERPLAPETIADITAAVFRHYKEGARNGIAHYLSAFLAKSGVPEDQCLTIIEALAVDDDDQEFDNRVQAVRRTYRRVAQGLPVTGYMRLGEVMPQHIVDYISQEIHPPPRITIITHPVPEDTTLFTETFGRTYDPPPRSCYYGLCGEYVKLMEPTTEAPVQFHHAAFGVFGPPLFGRKFHTYHALNNVYANIMAVIVGDSGTSHKDTCIRAAKELFWLGATQHSAPWGYLTHIDTMEGLVQELKQYEPDARLVVYVREFNSLLLKSRREVGSGVLPLLQDLWDSPDQVDVATRKDPLSVTEPFVSLIGSVTPTLLARDASAYDVEGGFANRVQWVFGSRSTFLPSPPEPDFQEKRRIGKEFLRAVDSYGPIKTSLRINKDPRAEAFWTDWSTSHHARGYSNEDEVNLTSRVQNNALRWALLHAITDGSRVITEDHLRAGCAWVDWCLEHTKREVRMWGADEGVRLQAKILALVKSRPMLRREIFEQLPGYGVDLLQRTMRAMEWLAVLQLSTDGRYVAP